MKARIINVAGRGNLHEVFNTSIGYMCADIFESVDYFCSPSGEQAMRQLLKNYSLQQWTEKINFVQIPEWKKDTFFQKLWRNGFTKAFYDLWYMWTMPRNAVAIYPHCVNAYFLWINSFTNRILRRKSWVFYHADLEHYYILKDKWASVFQRFLFKSFFKYWFSDKRIAYCVLGKSILNNLQPFLNKCHKSRWQYINAPIFLSNGNKLPENSAMNTSIKIATIGNMGLSRGILTLLEIAEELKDEVKLSVIGCVNYPLDYREYPFIDFAVNRIKNVQHFRSPLTREEFDKEVSSLDYILFLIPPTAYKLTASGTIFDALILEKPIIAFHNDFFDETLSLPCGYMLNSKEEIIAKIKELQSTYPNNPDREEFIKNMHTIRENFRVENVAPKWQEKIEQVFGEKTK